MKYEEGGLSLVSGLCPIWSNDMLQHRVHEEHSCPRQWKYWSALYN